MTLVDTPADQLTIVPADQVAAVGVEPFPHQPETDTAPVGWKEELVHLNRIIRIAADTLDDLENVRKGNKSRIGHLTATTPDTDGNYRGLGLPLDHHDVVRLHVMNTTILTIEREAIRHLEGLMRQHPLGPWAKHQKGVGDKQLARFIAAVGDPYTRPGMVYRDGTTEPERVRKLPEFRSYCGYALTDDGVALSRRKGTRITWNPEARMRLWNVADSCLKGLRKPCVTDMEGKYATHVEGCACFPYRIVYDTARARYVYAVHHHPCAQCGGKDNPPAPAGSPLKDGHKHFRGLRAISQAVLTDVWREARRIHELDGDL